MSARKAIFISILLFLIFRGEVSVPAQTNTVEPVLTRIADLLSASKYDEAIALFDTIPLPERDSTHVRLIKATVLSSAGKYAEARAIAEAVVKGEPNNIEALFVLANVERAQGRDRQQRTALERIIKIEPDNVKALIDLGNLNLRTRSYRAAAGNFHRVITKDPKNFAALLGMGRTFRMNGEWADAELYFNRAVELHPALPEARSERARFYRARGRMKEALADLDEAKKLNPADYWIAIDRGTVLMDINRKPEALEEFSRAVNINPREFLGYVYTSGLKDDLGDTDGAEKDYAVLAKLKPDYYYALEGLGLHKMKNGNWAEARDAFMEAYRKAPQENCYALLAAISWIRMDDLPGARTFLGQAHAKVKRDTLEWYMFRLYHDLTARNYAGENDMAVRLDQEKDQDLKARMMFYMAMYYDIRGNAALANKYFLLVRDMDKRAIPEWRLNEWIIVDRKL